MTRASDLIQEAYCIANILDPSEIAEGYMASQGLNVLNTIIDQWSSLGIYIPYYKTVTIDVLENDYDYTVSPIITEIGESNLVDSSNVKSLLHVANLKEFNSFNFDLVVGRPSRIFIAPIENDIQSGSKVYLYPTPDANYTAIVYAKQLLSELTYSEEITALPKFYLKALKYQMALDLSIIFSTVLTPQFKSEYDKVMAELKAANAQDMSVQNNNPFYSYRRYRPWGSYVG